MLKLIVLLLLVVLLVDIVLNIMLVWLKIMQYLLIQIMLLPLVDMLEKMLVFQYVLCEFEQCHIRPSERAIYSKESQECEVYAKEMMISMAKQFDYATMKEVFARFEASEPHPKGELEHVNAYTLVVAVALSAQATDAGVNKATRKLFAVADTPEKMLELGLEGVTEHIKTIGLFRQKAKNVIKLSQILVDQYNGEVPSSRAALQSLPGVGRKTANVVLNMWFGHPAQAVDTHIFRVGNRSGICPGKDVDAVERAIEDNVPVEYQRHAHHWLILHGRYICVARKPKCQACPIKDLCQFEEKNL